MDFNFSGGPEHINYMADSSLARWIKICIMADAYPD